jgi:hypothetical protein
VRDSESNVVAGGNNYSVGTQRAFSFASPKAERYFLLVENASGCDPAGRTPSAYRIDITPPGSITTGLLAGWW